MGNIKEESLRPRRKLGERVCGGKIRFNTREDACKGACKVRTVKRHEIYYCEYCDGWHLGRPRIKNEKRYREIVRHSDKWNDVMSLEEYLEKNI